MKNALNDLRSDRYSQAVKAKDHRIELRYVPKTLRILEGSGTDSSARLTTRLLDSLGGARGIPNGMLFLMRLGPSDTSEHPGFANDIVYGKLSGYGDYQTTLTTYQFGLQDRIWMEAEGKRYALVGYQMENNFGMSPERTFMLLFPDPIQAKATRSVNVQVVLDDIVPGLGRKKFEWAIPAGKYDQSI